MRQQMMVPVFLEAFILWAKQYVADKSNGTRELMVVDVVKADNSFEPVIRKKVTEYYQVDWADVLSPNRKPQLVQARHAYIYICRKVLRHSLNTIAANVRREHTTVLNALQDMEEKISIRDERAMVVLHLHQSIINEKNTH